MEEVMDVVEMMDVVEVVLEVVCWRYLHVLLVDVMSQVGELSVAVRTGLCLAGALLLHLGHHHRVVVVVVVVHQA